MNRETIGRTIDTDAPLGSVTTAWPATSIAGRYEILGLLGAGAMGSVFRVRDAELGEIVALKFLRRELLADARMLERFRGRSASRAG